MRHNESRRYEMLLRVRDFGQAHQEAFPPSSPGGEVFQSVADAVARVSAQVGVTTNPAVQPKHVAQTELLKALQAVTRCARVIAKTTPGFGETFRAPRSQSAQALLVTARQLAREAEKHRLQFVQAGLHEAFVQDLDRLTSQFGEAIRAREAARGGLAAVRATVKAEISAALALVQRLDIYVTTRYRNDPGMLATWDMARRVELRRNPPRVSRPETLSTPTPQAGSVADGPSGGDTVGPTQLWPTAPASSGDTAAPAASSPTPQRLRGAA